jgi:ribosome-binding protein aMBF1 (putative translation factor)
VCALCDRDIQKSVKVRCAECKPSFVMCLECYRKGMTKEDTHPQHKSSHPYLMHDNLNYPMVMPEWSAKDELQMI